MKSKRVAIPILCVALGYISGRHFPSSKAAPMAGPGATDAAASSRFRTRDSLGPSIADRMRPQTTASDRTISANAGEPRVSIPLSSVIGILSSRPAGINGFEHYEQPMGEALTLLGASGEERAQVMERMAQTRSELLETERQVLKADIVSDFEVGIDLRKMDDAALDIMERTRSDLKSILPEDIGEALVTSVNWNNFYRSDIASDPGGVRFGISRDADDKLIYQVNFSNGSSIMGNSEWLQDDGKGIPADLVFPERWRELLAGVELLPQEDE